LWIAFELYLWEIEHNCEFSLNIVSGVVNCFWIVSLRDWAQLWKQAVILWLRCELLLNCIFERLSTTELTQNIQNRMLWIAFELYLWEIEHNGMELINMDLLVVNCFWIVSLRDWAQLDKLPLFGKNRCELLLNCIFERLSTTWSPPLLDLALLWIAFELYLWEIEHNRIYRGSTTIAVVNCFWIVSLRDWAQRNRRGERGK